MLAPLLAVALLFVLAAPVPVWAQDDVDPMAPVDLGVFGEPIRFEAADGTTLSTGAGRRLIETVEVRANPSRSGLVVIADQSTDTYVEGIAEMPTRWPAAALQAQAIAARTYAWYQINLGTFQRRGLGYDICATTACQVFRGRDVVETPEFGQNWAAAVAATSGKVLTFDDGPILARYFSTSGGQTRNNEDIFASEGAFPYLKGIDDPFDAISPLHTWQAVFTRAQFDDLLSRGETLAAAVPVASVDVQKRGGGQPDLVTVTQAPSVTPPVPATETSTDEPTAASTPTGATAPAPSPAPSPTRSASPKPSPRPTPKPSPSGSASPSSSPTASPTPGDTQPTPTETSPEPTESDNPILPLPERPGIGRPPGGVFRVLAAVAADEPAPPPPASVTVTAGDLRSFLNSVAPQVYPGEFPGPRGDGGTLPSTLPSSRYTVDVRDDVVVVNGTGWGHGVGMGQYGAYGRALEGQSAEQILAAYYNGLKPTAASGLPERVRVGLTDDADVLDLVADGPMRVLVGDTVIAETAIGGWQVRDAGDDTMTLVAPAGYGVPLVVSRTLASRSAPFDLEPIVVSAVVNKTARARLVATDDDGEVVGERALGVVAPGRTQIRVSPQDLGVSGNIALAILAIDEIGIEAGTAVLVEVITSTSTGPPASLLGVLAESLPAPEPGPDRSRLALVGLLGLLAGLLAASRVSPPRGHG